MKGGYYVGCGGGRRFVMGVIVDNRWRVVVEFGVGFGVCFQNVDKKLLSRSTYVITFALLSMDF